jgi:hypothetical protein
MSERRSLSDQEPVVSGRGGSVIKIVGAALLLIGAVGVLGWGLGLFDGGPGSNTTDQAELNERFEEQAQEEEAREERSPERRTNAGG